MARLLSSGFELNSLTAGVEISDLSEGTSGQSANIVTSPVKSGTYSFESKYVSAVHPRSNVRYVVKSTATADDYYLKFDLYIAETPGDTINIAVLRSDNVTDKITLKLNADLTLELWNTEDTAQIGSDSSALSLNTWYRIEIKLACTTLSTTAVEGRIDGTSFASATINLAAGLQQIVLGKTDSGNDEYTLYFDDIALNDDSGSYENSWVGEEHIIRLGPNAAGDANEIDPESANNYQAVDEVTPDDATSALTIDSGTDAVGELDDYNIDNTPAGITSTSTIKVVHVGVRYKGSAASTDNDSFVVRVKSESGGTVEESSAIQPNSTSYVTNANSNPKTYPLSLYGLPGASSTPWTKALLDTAQIGFRKSADANNGTSISTIWMLVAYGPSSVPELSISVASGISQTYVTGNGEITAAGTSTITRRGFQYNTVDYPDKEVYEDGSFTTGTFSLSITDLTPATTYYYRAFATNSSGTSYSSWQTFTTSASTYSVTIDGVDRTGDILINTLIIEDMINDKQNTCSFQLLDLSGNGFPSTDDEIIITLSSGTRLFAGYVVNISMSSRLRDGTVVASVNCVDYVRLLDRNLVHKTYQDQTDAEIIADIVNTYCPGFGITTTNVVEGVTIDQIQFNYIQPSQCLRKIADLTGRNWYIDYSKDIHYFPLTQTASPFNITSSSANYFDMNISKDASQLKNRVYVRGGTKLSDATFYETKGDGAVRKFVLPDKPHEVTVKVNGVTKTLGIKNINTSGYDYYLNFQEKYVEQDSGATVLATTDTLRVEYQYDVPILVAVEDTASIITNGVKEFAIFDKTIATTTAARDRASAELTDYADSIVEGSFKTYTTGFFSGQYININLSDYGINDDYIIQKVVARSFGAGNYEYEVSIASSKTMGIIRFLIELLEANRNLIELDDNEVIDELLAVSDSLLSDSLTDSLTIDSAGAYATWCTDSLQATPITRARWNLFQWG